MPAGHEIDPRLKPVSGVCCLQQRDRLKEGDVEYSQDTEEI